VYVSSHRWVVYCVRLGIDRGALDLGGQVTRGRWPGRGTWPGGSNWSTFVCYVTGHVSHHVDGSGAARRSPRKPEPVWQRPVIKPGMSDALWEATRTEVLGSGVFQPVPQPSNYELYKVQDWHPCYAARHSRALAAQNREMRGFSALCWWRGRVVKRWSLTGELSLSCARPTADGWPLTWVSRPLLVSQLGRLRLHPFGVDKRVVSCN